jgi:hypothetical protein
MDREPQESRGSRPGLILRGAKKRHSFSGGRKPLKHTIKAGKVFLGSAGGERVPGKPGTRPPDKEKKL